MEKWKNGMSICHTYVQYVTLSHNCKWINIIMGEMIDKKLVEKKNKKLI
jgi:hypothetical protein